MAARLAVPVARYKESPLPVGLELSTYPKAIWYFEGVNDMDTG